MNSGEGTVYQLKRRQKTDPWGFKITTIDGEKTFITGVFENTPAAKAGVEIDEIILSVNNKSCLGLSHDEVSNIIRRSENKIDLITRKQLEDESKAGRQASKMASAKEINTKAIYYDSDPKVTKTYDATGKGRKRASYSNKKMSSAPNIATKPPENDELERRRSRKQSQHHSTSKRANGDANSSQAPPQLKHRRSETFKKEYKDEIQGSDSNAVPEINNKNGVKGHHKSKNNHTQVKQTAPNGENEKIENPPEVRMRKHRKNKVKEQKSDGEDGDPKLPLSFYLSMAELQATIPRGNRRTLLLSTPAPLEERIACLNEL